MHIAALVLPVFVVIVTGRVVGRLGILPRTLADGLVQFAYYVAMPALMFGAVAKERVVAILDLPFAASFAGAALLLVRRGSALATVDGLAAAMANPVLAPTLPGLAYAASGLPLPAIVDDYLAILAGALTSCALFASGLGLHHEQRVRNRPRAGGRHHRAHHIGFRGRSARLAGLAGSPLSFGVSDIAGLSELFGLPVETAAARASLVWAPSSAARIKARRSRWNT